MTLICYCCVITQSPGGAVVGYRLYVFYVGADDNAVRANRRRLLHTHITEWVQQVALRGCQVTVASETDVAAVGNGIRKLNEAMIGAYIDDNVDYFHVILPNARLSYRNEAR